MKTVHVRPDGAEIVFTAEELDLLRNGLNEARLAVKGEADFETRLGVTREEARALIHELIAVMEQISRARTENVGKRQSA